MLYVWTTGVWWALNGALYQVQVLHDTDKDILLFFYVSDKKTGLYVYEL